MIVGVVVGVLVLDWLFGRTRGFVGALVGAVLGAFVMIGFIEAATHGDLTSMYTPAGLARSGLVLGLTGAAAGLLFPHATTVAAIGWGVGAFSAAVGVAGTPDAAYALPLGLHVLAAAVVVRIAASQIPRERERAEHVLGR